MQLFCIKELKASFVWGVLKLFLFFSPKCNLTKADPEVLFPKLGTTHSKCYPPAAEQVLLVLVEGKPEVRAEGKLYQGKSLSPRLCGLLVAGKSWT